MNTNTLFDVEPEDVIEPFYYFMNKMETDKSYKKHTCKLYQDSIDEKCFRIYFRGGKYSNVYYFYPTILIHEKIIIRDYLSDIPAEHAYSITNHPFTLNELTIIKRLHCNKELVTKDFFKFYHTEQQYIEEEKRKLLQIKQHLKQEKKQLDLERAAFEKEKQVELDFDVDAYFKEITLDDKL